MSRSCRILVVSDSHRKDRYLKEAVRKEEPFDMLIHCGDVEGNIYSILGTDTPYEIRTVRGNCDYSGYSDDLLLTVCSHRIFVTHGHRYNVRYGNSALLSEALRKKADIVCFGHSHEPQVDFRNGILFLNPGSIAEPRQLRRENTYAILTLEENKMPRADICVL